MGLYSWENTFDDQNGATVDDSSRKIRSCTVKENSSTSMLISCTLNKT